MGLTVSSTPKSLLALDTEVANRWWWYDGKSTHRLMMFVGQWIETRDDYPQLGPFGWIIVPDALLNGLTDRAMRAYRGLPLTTRQQALGLIRRTIIDADVLVGHNLTGFDIGTINGELKIANMELLPERDVIDTLNSARKTMGQAMSLANRLSRLPDAVAKPHVNPAVWEAAFNEFEPDAMWEVWNRATTDVQGHIQLFLNDRAKGYV